MILWSERKTRQTAADLPTSVGAPQQSRHALVAGGEVVDHGAVAELGLNTQLDVEYLAAKAAALELGRHDQAALAATRPSTAHVPRVADR